ncbi:MAG: metalloprotease TldD [Cycloclasticus sp. symbiont of Bathymodiolus heckerae]|nr:MAG: metalloprotease TldD [Cycloclasticus sp. symbiont of Bathymodiolus heckerae]
MSDLIQQAESLILQPVGLGINDIDQVMGGLLSNQIDQADVYFQTSRSESWVLEDGIVKDGSYNIEQGVGLRAVSGEKTGFAYSEELALPNLLEAAKSVKAIASKGQSGIIKAKSYTNAPSLYAPLDPLDTMSREEKVRLLKRIDQETRQIDSRIDQVIVSLIGVYDVILVATEDGSLSADIRPLVRMNVSVIVEENGRREQGGSGGGARQGYEYFLEEDRAMGYAREAVRLALVNLEAVDAPAGNMTVVLGPGWPGILLHEAIGHGLEGDFNRKGSSAFSGRLGQKVASPLCTIVDDGTLENRRGSLSIDDEGVQSQCTTLIENGVLKGYMQDKMNARLMGQSPTGNGRRESYAHLPMPRMTNTYMLAGDSDPAEILASVENGLYAANFAGGQVDITSGKFVFSASEAYLIKNGKITVPVKGATIIGNGPDVLTKVSMVGNDLALDSGVGTCGKEGQSVPVGVGQPTLKIDGLTVGGTHA